ncbi:tyrosinase [Rhizoctonia solani]|nr:tyrosinase [Rhizoctonia solani]QRW26626.1 tyrosinase [Rhizoctonia solani]
MRLPCLFLVATSALFHVVSGVGSSHTCATIEVRREWRNLTSTERKAWIDASNCLNTRPRSGKLNPPVNTAVDYPGFFNQIVPINENSTYYDDLVYAHMNLNPLIHFTGFFLPWHRLYLHEWTNALRSECGYEGIAPYWAWEKDAADFENSAIWDTDPESGLGGFGDPNDDYTVKTGALNITVVYPITHKLRRRYTPILDLENVTKIPANSTFSQEEVNSLLAQPEGNFTAFHASAERFVGMHTAIHYILGGDLAGGCPKGSSNTTACPIEGAPTFSPNEPMFHMHHGNIDRFWWMWQEKSDLNKAAFHGGSVQNLSNLATYPNGQPPWLNKTSPIPTAGMFDSYTIEQVMDTRSWPLCYIYE